MGEYVKTKYPGILKYSGPKGEIYTLDFYAGGKRHREVVGPNLDEARKELERRRDLGRKRKYVSKAEKRKPTFQKLVDDYLDPANQNGNSLRYSLPPLLEHFGKMNLHRIDPEAIKAFRNKRKETPTQHHRERSGTSVNRELAALRFLLNHALLKKWIEENPFQRFSLLKQKIFYAEEPRTRTLTIEEITRLQEVCSAWLERIVRAALLTGLRLSDILGLRRENIDLKAKVVRFWEKKKKDWRLKPINSQMVALLESLGVEVDKEGYVFHGPNGNAIPSGTVKHAFRRARKRAGLLDLYFHDLRRASATFLMEQGTPLPVIQKHLGHTKIEMTRRYLGIRPELEAQEIEKLGGLFHGQKLAGNENFEPKTLENHYGNV